MLCPSSYLFMRTNQLSLYLCILFFVHSSIHPSGSLFIPSFSVRNHGLSDYPSYCLYLSLYLWLELCSVCFSVSLFVCLSVTLWILLPVFFNLSSVCLSVCPSLPSCISLSIVPGYTDGRLDDDNKQIIMS